MPNIDDKFLEELKRRNNIVDVIGRYCLLKRQGPSNYWARCPLPGHSEKTPSFSVNEPGQFYHCFGCGKGGDVIKFIQEVESLSFYESVKFLAEACKMEMPTDDNYDDEQAKKIKNKKDRLYSLLRDTALFYVNNLKTPKAKDLKNYLIDRGVTESTQIKFGIGASTGYYELPTYLKSKGYTEEEMLDAGVCQRGNQDKLYDCEAERLIIPIINSMGKVIAFGGRILQPKGMAKYKNTKETIIFNKKRTLFGINNLKVEKNDKGLKYVIMVEGYMDAISLYQAGFKNVVASMGTSLTLEQAKLLKRYTDVVLVSYDGDSAGQNATVRSLDIFADEGFEVKIVQLEEGKDPDDIIRSYGREAYQKLLDDAKPLVDFKFDLLLKNKDLNDVSDKRKYVNEGLDFIRKLKDEFLREEFLKKLRDISGITYESLKRDLETGAPVVEKEDFKVQVKIPVGDKIVQAERFILISFLDKKSYASNCDLQEFYFNDEIRQKIADEIIFSASENLKVQLANVVGESGLLELNEVLNSNEKINKNIEEKYFKDCIITLKKDNLENDIKRLNSEYAKETDLTKRQEIATIILKLTAKLAEI